MIGVSTVLPTMLQDGNHEAALYLDLSTMALDEGRHFKI